MKTTRRQFLSAALAAAALTGCKSRRKFSGGIVGAPAAAGHRLRTASFPPAAETESHEAVVAGGGIAGLAAARRIVRKGIDDVLILELDTALGGNSASGRNAISAYPWGAHYVPLPNAESVEVLELFAELGLITGTDAEGLPIYDELNLCSDPIERLFTCGRWQDGLLPQVGVTAADRAEYAAFFAQMDSWREAVGSDERPAFAIPVDRSSGDEKFRELDRLTMAEFMSARGWNSEPLRWYVDYCCRDDYGAGAAQVSAWAGLHYFAARRGRAANAASDAVLTWPEGNGWIVQRLAEPLANRVRPSSLVWRIEPADDGVTIDYFDLQREQSVRILTRAVVCAAPRFVAQRIIPSIVPAELEYSPWVVANVTLDSLPNEAGAHLAWDNVFRDSRSLGYIVATHQHLHPFPRKTVLTHYTPLDDAPPREARERALARSYESWCDFIIVDLERVHRGIARQITHLDVWVWGHGMVRPVPGFIWGETRRHMFGSVPPLFFAHSDMSGISIFEEAYTRGVQAADALVHYVRA